MWGEESLRLSSAEIRVPSVPGGCSMWVGRLESGPAGGVPWGPTSPARHSIQQQHSHQSKHDLCLGFPGGVLQYQLLI
jgi:hypothetical protein